MTVHRKIAGLCAMAALSLAFAAPALAAPAGDEYLPKIPQSGAHSSGGSSGGSSASGGSATTLPKGGAPTSSDAKASKSGADDTSEKQDNKKDQITPVGSSGSGGSDGGDSSGSILFNPIVLLMIAAVIAVAVGMTLRRRSVDEGDAEPPGTPGPGGRPKNSPRTPDGEIATGHDRIS
jgi:hypothetical protein